MIDSVRIVIDTNVLISRLLLPASIPGKAVKKAVDEAQLLVSDASLAELAAILARPNSMPTSQCKTGRSFFVL